MTAAVCSSTRRWYPPESTVTVMERPTTAATASIRSFSSAQVAVTSGGNPPRYRAVAHWIGVWSIRIVGSRIDSGNDWPVIVARGSVGSTTLPTGGAHTSRSASGPFSASSIPTVVPYLQARSMPKTAPVS